MHSLAKLKFISIKVISAAEGDCSGETSECISQNALRKYQLAAINKWFFAAREYVRAERAEASEKRAPQGRQRKPACNERGSGVTVIYVV